MLASPDAPRAVFRILFDAVENQKANAGFFRGMLQQQEKCGEQERHYKRYSCGARLRRGRS
jgi:hypothetical protein